MRQLVAVSIVVAACSDTTAPRPATEAPPTARVAIVVAPLSLPGVADVCYDLAVDNGTGARVWSRGALGLAHVDGDADAICASDFGNGAGGDVTYVGPCDASAGAERNTVTLWVDGVYGESGADVADWRDPCPQGCALTATCRDNADTPVAFDLVVFRGAQQGFFDLAVSFDDIFCSAKLDTCRPDADGDGQGEPIELLFDPDDKSRNRTAVLAVACSAAPDAGADVTTTLHARAAEVTCTRAGAPIHFAVDPTRGPGNTFVGSRERDDADVPLATLHYAVYWDTEELDCGGGAGSCNKVFWNLAIDIDELVEDGLTACRISYDATASDGSGDVFFAGAITRGGTSYPMVHVDDDLFTCEENPLDGPGSSVTTRYCTSDDLTPTVVCPALCFAYVQDSAGPAADPTCAGCTPGEPCDDGDLCTRDDTCVAGACRGEVVSCAGADGACRETNLAAAVYGASAVASSEHTSGLYDAARAIDGDLATEWVGGYCVGCATNTLTVTLAEPSRLVRYELDGVSEERPIVAHALEYQDALGAWQPLATDTPTSPRPGAFAATFTPVTTGRVRLTITSAPNPVDQTVLFELALFGRRAACDFGCAPWNVAAPAAGTTVTASSLHESGDFPALLAIDGDPTTRWVSAYCVDCETASLTLDLGGARTLSSFDLVGLAGDDDPTVGCTLEYDDGGVWLPLPYTSTTSDTVGHFAGTFTPVTTARVRVTVRTWEVSEPVQLEVYELVLRGVSSQCEPTCLEAACNPMTGACDVPVEDGASCADAFSCDGEETCVAGECTPGEAIVCDDVSCDRDVCLQATGACACDDPPSCEGSSVCTPGCEGTPCDDGDACTSGDTCVAEVCAGQVACDDGDPCTTDPCVDGVCGAPVWTCATTTPGTLVFEVLPALGADGLFHTAGRVVPVNGSAGYGDPHRVGRSYTLDSADLSIVWGPAANHDACDTNNGASMPALSDSPSRVFVQGDWNDGTPQGTDFCASIFAKDAATGDALWSQQPGGPHPRHPIALSETHAFYGGWVGSIRKFRLSDGAIEATMGLQGSGSEGGSIVLLASGDMVATQHNHRAERWTPDGTRVWTSTVLRNDLFVTTGDHVVGRSTGDTAVSMIDGATGSELWSRPAPEVYGAILTDADGHLYYGERDAMVSRAANGDLRWTVPLTGRVDADFLGDDGRVYVRTAATLYAIDVADGAVRWRFDAVGGTVSIEGTSSANRFGGPFALLAGGDIFGSDYAGRSYRLETGGLGYAASVWPRPRGNRLNSGRAGHIVAMP